MTSQDMTDQQIGEELKPLADTIRNAIQTRFILGDPIDRLVAEITIAVGVFMGPIVRAELASRAPQAAAEQVHDELWRHLDWSFWGTGMADVFREPLAESMLAGITPEQRQQANELITRWRDHRKFVGRDTYEAQKAEIERLRAQLTAAGINPDEEQP
ncbi:hypothetical protein [Kitasatospora camelliae]|uniref:Uncharacterized protein n=1 Tax=Kitasatospora camelliae TaxID=3156397 RepID=A0AAU8K2P1_9ACTN